MATTTDDAPTITVLMPEITTSTNLGPLTKKMSFPAGCTEDLYDMKTTGLGFPWTYNTAGCAMTSCCPSGGPVTEDWGWLSSFYSPGVCPSGYRGCSPPAAPNQLSTKPGETIEFCCPNAFGCPNPTEAFGACISLLSTARPITVLNNMFDQDAVSTTTFKLDPTMGASYQIAYPIQIRNGGRDDPATTQPPSETASATTASENGHEKPGSSGGSDDGGSSSALSTGAIVGIAVGLFAFGLLCAGLGWFFYRLHRKRALDDNMKPNVPYPQPQSPPATNPGIWKSPQPSVGPQEMASPAWSGVTQGHNSWMNPPNELDQRNYSAPPMTELEAARNRGAELGDQNYR